MLPQMTNEEAVRVGYSQNLKMEQAKRMSFLQQTNSVGKVMAANKGLENQALVHVISKRAT